MQKPKRRLSKQELSKQEEGEGIVHIHNGGYFRFVDSLGDDLSVVNAARASFEKESRKFRESDAKLLRYLFSHNHTSPTRHAALTFEVRAPLMVARQWWKHIIGCTEHEVPYDRMTGWNEASRRYVTSEVEFYLPDSFRGTPENRKQGSSENGVSVEVNEKFLNLLEEQYKRGKLLYERAMEEGICAEQARLFLPAYGLYVCWRWTCSLQAVLHFLKLRDHGDAQSEIWPYAKAAGQFVQECFPETYKAWAEQ